MRFDPADGNKPTQTIVKTGTLSLPPENNPVRDGFRFDGWTRDGLPFDFKTPILQDTTLKAKWTKTQDWTLNPDHGPASGARLTISPPDKREAYFVSVQAAGEQTVGLTGDGRIYTWTQDSTLKQVSSPAQAPDEFHYLQAAADNHWQVALGSDHRIYTWNSRQTTPTILDTGRNAGFTCISMNSNRLLAVSRQSRVYVFGTGLAGSQNQNLKPTEQATFSLPGKAQAVTAIASGRLTLIVDADGQAWTWDGANTRSAKLERIKQEPGMRTVQTQALNKGFLLLNTDGHAYHLADSMTSPTAVSLPGGTQIGRINNSDDQAIITSKDGYVWSWKPGEAPKRTNNGNKQYIQAAESNSRITAISRQGSVFTWSLDEQDNPGNPARLDTTQAPTLESASLDGQALTISKNNGSWQADAPAHKPGQAAITISGRQDSRPFTRSLKYMVEQPLTRDNQQGTTYTVTFNADGGSPKPGDQTVSTPYGRVKRPSPDPVREGFLFDGWFIGQVAYDFSKPVTKDLTLTAKWTESKNSTWSISPDKGSQLGRESTTITPPDSTRRNIRFSQVSAAQLRFSLAVGSDGNAYAWGDNRYGQLGDGTKTSRSTPVMVKKPDRTTYPDVPADFTYVQVSTGTDHSLAVGSDGYAYAWGYNSDGQLGNNSTNSSPVPVRVRDPSSPTDTSRALRATQVSAGSEYSLALGSDGYAYAWGYNNFGQLGNGGGSSTVPARVRDPASPTDTGKGLKAKQVSAGTWSSLALGSDGYAYAWGYNNLGQLGDGTKTSRSTPVMVKEPDRRTYPDLPADFTYAQVSAGYEHSLALGSDGYAYAWGFNNSGQLGNNTTSDRGGNPVPARVRDPASPTDTGKGLKAKQVSAGIWHSLAIDTGGNTWAWGGNSEGQLGNNTTNNQTIPVRVFASAHSTSLAGPWLNTAQISAEGSSSLVLGTDGYAYAYGGNYYGQLGDGTRTDSKVPVPVVFPLPSVITGVRFDQTAVSGLTRGDGNSVIVLTPAHQPGTVTVSVDYTIGGAPQQPDNSLKYTYTPVAPAGVLPQAGGEGILLALATGTVSMGGILASRRQRREQHRLLHASHE